jgi:hypothetical protein
MDAVLALLWLLAGILVVLALAELAELAIEFHRFRLKPDPLRVSPDED